MGEKITREMREVKTETEMSETKAQAEEEDINGGFLSRRIGWREAGFFFCVLIERIGFPYETQGVLELASASSSMSLCVYLCVFIWF